MSKMMILGVKGEDKLWLVDFEAGSVTAMDGTREDYMARHDAEGATSDVDVAVAVEPAESAFSGRMYKTPENAEFTLVFDTEETAFSGQYYKTPASGSSAVDVAVAVETVESPFSGRLYKTPENAEFSLVFDTEETAFSGQYYKTPASGSSATERSSH